MPESVFWYFLVFFGFSGISGISGISDISDISDISGITNFHAKSGLCSSKNKRVMLNLVFGVWRPSVPVTNLHIELPASCQLIRQQVRSTNSWRESKFFYFVALFACFSLFVFLHFIIFLLFFSFCVLIAGAGECYFWYF